MQMVDRKLLVEDWQQIEQALCDMEKADQYTFQADRDEWWKKNTPIFLKGLYRFGWHILEYLVRRDKA